MNTSRPSLMFLLALSVLGVSHAFYAATDWNNGGCVLGCSICYPNYTSCAVCADRNGLDGTGKCRPCADPFCTSCSADYTRCTSCSASLQAQSPDGQAQLGVGIDGVCVPCMTYGCESCAGNSSACDSCPTWQGINKSFGTCEPCHHPACTECMADSSKCTRCKADGWSVDPTNSTCIQCTIDSCLACNSDGTCQQCLTGYGNDGSGGCAPCKDPRCFQCFTNASVCESCFTFASLDPQTKTCRKCDVPMCNTCNGDGTCGTCFAGYGRNGTGGCAPCAEGCSVCSADAGVCEACAPFYAPSGNGTDGVECTACTYKAVCTDVTKMNPYSSGGVWEINPNTCSNLSATQPEQVFPNGTVCGVCSSSAPTPMPISAAFFNITTWVRNTLMEDQAGFLASALCDSGFAPLTSLDVIQPHSWCAWVTSKPPSSTARHDIRFRAAIQCGPVKTEGGVRALVNVTAMYDEEPQVTVWNVQPVVLG